MSCSACNIHKRNFSTEKEYVLFKKHLDELVEKGKMKKIQNDVNTTVFFTTEYHCNLCNSEWFLSVPDQAYRGNWCEKR